MTFLALLLALASLGASLALATRVRALAKRLTMIERGPERVPLEGRKGGPCEGPPKEATQGCASVPLASPPRWKGLEAGSPLAGLRVAFAIRQDHPHPVFAGLLKEKLLQEEALIDDAAPDIRIEGEIVGNGYADVYFRAELTATLGDETILALSDRPPHGDRPANLAAEVVRRLEEELRKRERHTAVRELHEPP